MIWPQWKGLCPQADDPEACPEALPPFWKMIADLLWPGYYDPKVRKLQTATGDGQVGGKIPHVPVFCCSEQINRWPCPLVGPLVGPVSITIRVFTTLQSDHRDIWINDFIRVMRRHDLTKKTHLPTYIPNHQRTYLSTSIREHPKGGIQETCDNWHLIRVMRRHDLTKNTYLPTSFREHP